jgi:hypothetical protein
MRKKTIISFYLLLFTSGLAFSQISENFNDGDFTDSLKWVGDTSDFIVNSSFQLQSVNTVANDSYYLSTPNKLATSAQWEFWISIAFNPSSANYVDAFLTASASDLSLASTTGYFVRMGNTDDEISFYRKDATGAITKVIDGLNGILNTSNNIIKIKVIRDAFGQWTLFRDLSGTGNNYVSEGSAVDALYNTSAFFGFFIKQSTSGFFQKHFFDDIEVNNYIPDVNPPEILSVTAVSPTTVDVLFNEPLDKISSRETSYYSANNGLGMPSGVILDAINPGLVYLTFGNALTNGLVYTLTVNGVKDLAENAINTHTSTFSFYTPQLYDVVIDELFPDPNPQVGLPLLKFLELKNISTYPINLQGWKLIDGSSTATLPSYYLLPDSFVIVCATNSTSAYSTFGPALGVANFPSMNIGGTTIVLKSADNQTIHAVQYDLSSYKNELKKDGGWSLEMIDSKNPCMGFDNWKAGTDASGGTPGRKNSVDGINKDENSPKLLRAFLSANNMVSLVFDEPVDSLKAASINNYTIGNGLSATSAITLSPFFNTVNITLNSPLAAGIIYTITANNISDCSGNIITTKNSAKFGIAQDADSLDIVINEILFNPLPLGTEYVEIYNRSAKIIDLSKIFIANRNSSNIISSIRHLTTENILFFPSEFMVLTTNPAAVKNQYITINADAFLQLNSMPSFSNDKGDVIILNKQGNVIDEVKYMDKWHFPLIHNTEGVSLERIDYDGPSVQSNFHSAATSVGYGTPGYKNSQCKFTEEVRGDIAVIPEIFSPDNDGTDDFVTINYSFPSPGFVANITIFDASGRPVRYLQKNSLSGVKGYYRWDGLDDKNRKLPQGIYIIYTEIFNTEGKKKSFKNTVVLGRRY